MQYAGLCPHKPTYANAGLRRDHFFFFQRLYFFQQILKIISMEQELKPSVPPLHHLYLLDYGAGNVLSLVNALNHLGYQIQTITSPQDFDRATVIIFPGVGAFGSCVQSLKLKGFWNPLLKFLKEIQIQDENPMVNEGDLKDLTSWTCKPFIRKSFMGICVGMQVLCESSQESGKKDLNKEPELGLGIIPGARVEKFSSQLVVPHMGWSGTRRFVPVSFLLTTLSTISSIIPSANQSTILSADSIAVPKTIPSTTSSPSTSYSTPWSESTCSHWSSSSHYIPHVASSLLSSHSSSSSTSTSSFPTPFPPSSPPSPSDLPKTSPLYYFVHSYALPYSKDIENWIYTTTKYENQTFVSSVRRGRIFGTQFHPEKSGPEGLAVLDAFLRDSFDLKISSPSFHNLNSPCPSNIEDSQLTKRIIACMDVRANDQGRLVGE